MSTYALNDLDPATRAFAEVRAREEGLSLADWLEALIHTREAPVPSRAHRYYGGGGWVPKGELPIWGRAPSAEGQVATASYDVDTAVHLAFLQYPDLAPVNLNRSLIAQDASASARSALRMIAEFPPRISYAAILLSAAFAEADEPLRLPPQRGASRRKAPRLWYHSLVDTCLHRSREVRNALVHQWTPSGRAEVIWGDAFASLCDLTSARHELLILVNHDRTRAAAELAKHLELVTKQFELSANLLAEIDVVEEPSKQDQFPPLRDALLEKAGGGVSLTEGAKLLSVTRQALHKRIRAGKALGMMRGDELVLPRLQWVEVDGERKPLPGLVEVLKPFEHAGAWSALQFLIDHDPNLAQTPISLLREGGSVQEVVAAARAYLGSDEE